MTRRSSRHDQRAAHAIDQRALSALTGAFSALCPDPVSNPVRDVAVVLTLRALAPASKESGARVEAPDSRSERYGVRKGAFENIEMNVPNPGLVTLSWPACWFPVMRQTTSG